MKHAAEAYIKEGTPPAAIIEVLATEREMAVVVFGQPKEE